jgi:hypothetical protein
MSYENMVIVYLAKLLITLLELQMAQSHKLLSHSLEGVAYWSIQKIDLIPSGTTTRTTTTKKSAGLLPRYVPQV